MRKPLILILLSVFVFSCKSEKPEPTLPPDTYEVNINAKDVYNGIRAHLNTVDNRKQMIPVDTAMVVNEAATFTGIIKSPEFMVLTINGVKNNFQFILEPGITTIEVNKDDIQFSMIDGSPINDAHAEYKQEYKKRADAASEVRRQANMRQRSADTTGFYELYYKSIDMNEELQSFNYDFIDDNPDNEFSLLLLETLIIGGNQDLNRFKENYKSVKHLVNKNPLYKIKAQKIETFIVQLEAIANLEIGKIAPNFSAPTPDGELIALNDIKGKATIIDFWASWCGPCRRENPNVVKVYEKYHDKGLEIISVSLDRPNQKDRWLQAIEKDNLNWHHVSNLKYFNDPVAMMYNITAIPATFILDENGRIVAKRLRGKSLEDQIARMLN